MSQIGFIMAVVITIGVISFSIFYVTNNFETRLDQMTVLELQKSADILETKILDLIGEDVQIVKAGFEETSGSAHEEQIMLTLDIDYGPSGEQYVQIYDEEFNLIDSENPLTFSLSLDANEKKHFNIFSSGNITDITYNDAPNMTARSWAQENYTLMSESKCMDINYDQIRDEIGHNFKLKIGSCESQLEPPQGTVVARTIPIVLKRTVKGIVLEKTFASILVW